MSVTAPGPIDLSGVIPPKFSQQIIAEATQQSVALARGNRTNMGTAMENFPVPKAFPNAAFVNAPGGRKSFTNLKLTREDITAEEIASVVAIPDAFLEDSDMNLWGYARPLLAEAIALAFDDAAIWGVGAPASYPAGGLAASAIPVATADDAVATVNDAMSAVERQGLAVTGSAADIAVKGAFRGVRDANGALLLGTTQTEQGATETLFNVPIAYAQFSTDASGDFITGAWRFLLIGVRQDIRYQFSTDGVLADEDGKVIISAYQDNQTLLKVWARFGVAVLEPVTRRMPDGAKPFAITSVADAPTGRRGRRRGGSGSGSGESGGE